MARGLTAMLTAALSILLSISPAVTALPLTCVTWLHAPYTPLSSVRDPARLGLLYVSYVV